MTLIKITIGNAFKEIYDVTLQSQHHSFCLGVTHTTVVFYHHRVTINIDQAKEDESLIVNILSRKSFNRWSDNVIFHLLHPLLIGERHR